jgi:hypothetical protein
MLEECWQVAVQQTQCFFGGPEHAKRDGRLMVTAGRPLLSTITSTTVPNQRWLPPACLIIRNAFRPLLAIPFQAIVLGRQTGTLI